MSLLTRIQKRLKRVFMPRQYSIDAAIEKYSGIAICEEDDYAQLRAMGLDVVTTWDHLLLIADVRLRLTMAERAYLDRGYTPHACVGKR